MKQKLELIKTELQNSRKKLVAFALLLRQRGWIFVVWVMLVVPYQNCGGGGGSGSGSSSSISGVGGTIPGGSGPTPTPDPGLPAGAGVPQDQNTAPTIGGTIGTQTVTIGLGANSGSKAVTGLTVTYSPGSGSNATEQAQQRVTLQCEVKNASGANHPYVQMAQQCGQQLPLGSTSTTFGIAIRNQNINGQNVAFECQPAAGDTANQTATVTYWIRDHYGVETAKKTFTVNVQNKCPAEARAKGASPEKLDSMGTAVAISGNYVIAVAPGDDGAGNATTGVGAVYFYELDSGNQTLTLMNGPVYTSGGLANDAMNAVAISSDYAVVGAPNGITGAGAVYIFKRSGGSWSQVQRITPPAGGNGQQFGFSVAFDGSQLIVGSPKDSVDALASGAAYVYQLNLGTNNFDLVSQLRPSAAAAQQAFGYSVALGNGYALVGSPYHSGNQSGVTGDVYFFAKNGNGTFGSNSTVGGTSTSSATLDKTGISNGMGFGTAVAANSGRAVVGAPLGGTVPGTAILFSCSASSCSRTAAFTRPATGVGNGSQFGISVAVSSSYVLIGELAGAGGAILYNANDPANPVFQHHTRDRVSGDQAGKSVAVDGSNVVLGIPLDDDEGTVTVDNAGSIAVIKAVP